MKYLSKISIFILTVFFSFSGLQAQNIDHERMNRDLNIMENVLQEMFKTSWSTHGNGVHVAPGGFSFGGSNDINGTYLPGYGVILTIPGGPPAFMVMSGNNDNGSTYHFQYGSSGDKNVSKETVINRIEEFLQDYGSTIGQLDDGNRITVIYDASHGNESSFVHIFSQNGSAQTEQNKSVPSIYVTAKKSDLEALRKGSISKSQFNDRLAISTAEEDSYSHHDIKIMANILKTTFEDANKENYRISGSVNHIYIDDLGALFYVDASYGSGFYRLDVAVRTLKKNLPKMVQADSNTVTISTPKADDQDEKEYSKKRAEAYQKFLGQMKETIVDYGRTLRSVQPNEQVYVSVSLSGSGDDVPERVDLQIPKSVLNSLDKGNISRDQAMSRINVREY